MRERIRIRVRSRNETHGSRLSMTGSTLREEEDDGDGS